LLLRGAELQTAGQRPEDPVNIAFAKNYLATDWKIQEEPEESDLF
jgi:hypothetical protein